VIHGHFCLPVPKELSGPLQEESQILLDDASLLAESLPVAIAALVQGDDEIKNGLRLRGHLSQSDALAGKRSSGPSVSDVRISPKTQQRR
jgi:hypothetical protein